MKHKIVFLDRSTLPVLLRQPAFPHDWIEHPESTADQVIERLRTATIAITNKVPLRREALLQLPKLQHIAVSATGTDVIDLEYCREHGIVVSNIRGYSKHSVPEHAITLMLTLRRNLLAFRADVENGAWQAASQFCLFTHPISDLHGSTLGLIGRGTLGQAVARLAEAFGMRVLFAEHKNAKDIRPGYTAFSKVLAESDVISLHCPLTQVTRNLIAHDELQQMQRHAVLINTARGGLVDEMALVKALQNGVIAGAGFDVLSEEPPRKGNPLLDLRLPNFILTPHIAWSSSGALAIMAKQLIDNIEAFVRGEPANCVVK